MATVGLCFKGAQTDKKGNTYFIIVPTKELLPLTITEDKLLCLKKLPPSDNEKAPKWTLDLFIPEKQEEKKEADIY